MYRPNIKLADMESSISKCRGIVRLTDSRPGGFFMLLASPQGKSSIVHMYWGDGVAVVGDSHVSHQ